MTHTPGTLLRSDDMIVFLICEGKAGYYNGMLYAPHVTQMHEYIHAASWKMLSE